MSIYVMSDIHGAYDKFKQMLKKINFSENDHLYILGDVIDRGTEPIALLLDIMQRSNVTLLMGNHEHMLYESLVEGNPYGSKYRKMWFDNGGKVTYDQFYHCSEQIQDIIFDYISSLPIIYPHLQVNNKNYYLAHSFYVDKLGLNNNETMQTLTENEIDEALWTRINPMYLYIKEAKIYQEHKDSILIVGHTPTIRFYIKEYYKYGDKDIIPQHIYIGNKGHLINVDCGCAYYACGYKTGRLGCLRLDDMQQFYT